MPAGSLGVVTGLVLGNSDVTLLARILGLNGQPVNIASIAGITWNIQDLTAQAEVASGSWVPSTVLFDSLQQNDPIRWDQDNVDNPGRDGLYGYNFLAMLPGNNFAVMDVDPITGLELPHKFQIDLEFTPFSGGRFRQTWQVVATPTLPIVPVPIPPAIYSLMSPTGGWISGGLVVVKGVGLANATGVVVGGTRAKWCLATDDNTLRFEYFPVSAAGVVPVFISLAGGGSLSTTLTFSQTTLGTTQVNQVQTAYMPTADYANLGWDGSIWWMSENTPPSHTLTETSGVSTQARKLSIATGCH